MRPPPGNNGGAVSGAGPCPSTVEAQNSRASVSHAHVPLPRHVGLSNVTSFPPARWRNPGTQMPDSRETTGGQTRCGGAVRPVSGSRAGRGNGQRWCEQRNLSHRIPRIPPSLRIQRARKIRHAQTRAAQKERASLAWSCSNPDHGGRSQSNASTCSTASPVLASSRPRSRMRMLRERLRVSPQRMAWLNASLTSLDTQSGHVNSAHREED